MEARIVVLAKLPEPGRGQERSKIGFEPARADEFESPLDILVLDFFQSKPVLKLPLVQLGFEIEQIPEIEHIPGLEKFSF